MTLRTKFNLGIIIVFVLLAAVITAATITFVETNTIREAEHRVRTYMRAAWEILDGRNAGLQSGAEILAHDQTVTDFLKAPDDEQLSLAAMEELGVVREELKADILSILGPDGTVLLRTHSPYDEGDSLDTDPLIRQVIRTRDSSAGHTLLDLVPVLLYGVGFGFWVEDQLRDLLVQYVEDVVLRLREDAGHVPRRVHDVGLVRVVRVTRAQLIEPVHEPAGQPGEITIPEVAQVLHGEPQGH